MKHVPIGISQRKTDTVERAMEILKDREMPKGMSKQDARRNFSPRPMKRAEKP